MRTPPCRHNEMTTAWAGLTLGPLALDKTLDMLGSGGCGVWGRPGIPWLGGQKRGGRGRDHQEQKSPATLRARRRRGVSLRSPSLR
eukprot:9279920-Pyramimonas_sp.AAC.1